MYIANIYSGDWVVKCPNLDLLWSIVYCLSHCSRVHVGRIVVCTLCEACSWTLAPEGWPTKTVTLVQYTCPSGTLG